MTMRAIVLQAQGTDLSLQRLTVPIPQSKTKEVQIRIHAVGLNPVDYKIRAGLIPAPYPLILGHDFSGVITQAAGPFKVGDAVMGYLCGPQSNGALAEYTCVPFECVTHKPAHLSMLEAAAYPVTALTAYQAMRRMKLQPKEATLITGVSGGVGLMLLQLARAAGAEVFTVVRDEASALQLQAHYNLDLTRCITSQGKSVEAMAEELKRKHQGRYFAKVFDLAGGDMKHLCLSLVDFEGEMLSIVEEAKFDIDLLNARTSPLFQRSATLHFEFLGARGLFGSPDTWQVYQQDLQAIAQLLAQGQLKFARIAKMGTLEVSDLEQALQQLATRQRSADKLVLEINDLSQQ